MADKPRFVDPLLTEGPPKEAPPFPGPTDPKARDASGPAAVSSSSSQSRKPASDASIPDSASLTAPSRSPEPVTGELLAASGASHTSAAGLQGERREVTRRNTQAQKHIEAVRRIDEKIRMGSAKIVHMGQDASKVLRPDEDEAGMGSSKPEGWTQRHFRIALDSRLPDKDAPAYIRHAHRVYESMVRSEALQDRKPSPTLNCDIQVVMKSEVTYRYEIVEAKED